ncbi:MAG: phosphohistidine phosphatase SixA [Deltaproteobacteria bacterium]
MILYVLRHAEAIAADDKMPDEWRYLTEKGIKSVTRISEDLSKFGRKPRLIVTSPLVRAVQTAQIAAGQACRKNELIVSGLLRGDGDLDELQDFLRRHAEAKRVMVVGHEPHLGSLVASLLQKEDQVHLQKAGCVALELDDDTGKPARFIWYKKPGKKPVTSFKKAFSPNPDKQDK